MNINTNISSLKINNSLRMVQNDMKIAMEKLSSGSRVNSSKDDAAGLAISERFTTQIRGSSKAIQNINDGLGLIQVADAASSSIASILQRTRELAIQSANGTFSSKDRESLNNEYIQLKNEIDHIANQTNFNNIYLLNQNGVGGVSQEVLDDLKLQIPHWIDDAMKHVQNVLGIDALPTGVNIDVQFYYDDTSGTRASMSGVPGAKDYILKVNLGRLLDGNKEIEGGTGSYPAAISGGDFDTVIAHELTHTMQFTKFPGLSYNDSEMWFIEGLASAVQGRNTYFNQTHPVKADANVNIVNWNGSYESSYAAIKTLHEVTNGGIRAVIDRLEMGETLDQAIKNTTQGDTGEFASINTGDGTGARNFTGMADFINWFNTSTEVDYYLNNSTDFTAGEGAITATKGGSNASAKAGVIANNTTIETGPNNGGIFNITFADVSSENLQLHVSAAATDTIQLSTFDLTAGALGIDNGNLLTMASSEDVIKLVDNALERIAEARGYYGAQMNRIDFMVDNLTTYSNNITSARSRIMDADMAKEQTVFVKNKLLTQSNLQMLTESQESRKSILNLLSN